MLYNRLILLILIAVSAMVIGCSQEEVPADSRSQDYVLTATQDQRNLLKYQFKVTHFGKELTAKDAAFLWNFGDAAGSSTEAAPVYEYVEGGERKVSVSIIMNKNAEGVSERVSQDTIILVGEQSTIYNSIITARPGEGAELLNYTLTSSAVPDEELGGVGLNYLWQITGPDGKNGENITTTYPEEGEVLTGNTVKHRFQKYGFPYDVNVYIKPANQAEFDMTKPTSTMYLTTVLPEIEISCKSTGKQGDKEGVECEPKFDYDIKHDMEYTWTFYSVSGGSITKDGDVSTTGTSKASFLYSTSGEKIVKIKGTHPTHMIGTAEGSANITLSSAGILNPINCFRPVDNIGNYTDKTKLVWRCEAQGYYNKKENVNLPLPLTSYTWKIKENGQYINGSGEGETEGFSWGTGDVAGGNDKTYDTNPNVKTRVDCDNAKNICTAAIIFTADKYGANYTISLAAKQNDQEKPDTTYNLKGDDETIRTDMPKLTGIERVTSETNPMQSTFTPTYDTEIPTGKTLKYYWTINGTPITGSEAGWTENNGSNQPYDGTRHITNRTLTHTFSKSGNYAITLRVTSDKFSNGTAQTGTEIEMPNVDGNTTANQLHFELNQAMAGSYFSYSINNLTNQVRFFTDYEARVDGKPVDTTYVFKIIGPTYSFLNTNHETTVVLRNQKEFETKIPKEGIDATNNARLLFGATYTVQLEVYNSSVYGTSNGIEGVTKKTLQLTNGDSGSRFSTKQLNFTKANKDEMATHWYETITPTIAYTESGTSYSIDQSLFTCRIQLRDQDGGIYKVGTTLPFTYATANSSMVTNCNNVFYVNADGANYGTENSKHNLNVNLVITGPSFDNTNNQWKTETLNFIMKYYKQ